MANDYKELIEYLDEKFTRIETTLESKADKSDVNALTNAIDKLVKSVENLKTEYSPITTAINRHETWLKQIAEKVGMKLEY